MLLEEIGRFAATQRGQAMPEAVTHAAVRCVVDWCAAAVPGARMEPVRLLAAALADECGHGQSRLVRDGRPAPPRVAALLNGAAAHVAEVDDIYSPGLYHPGAPTIAAALAAAEARDVDGPTFLRAVTLGYEVGDRLAEAMAPAHYQFWHPTGTVGAVGAAAAVAALLALDTSRFAHALATAATLGAGLQQAFRSDAMSKPLHAGHAAEVGVLAAFAAEAGVTGAPDVLEGEAGFGRAMSQDVRWDVMTDGLGRDWRITRTTIKPHVGCGHTFPAVDAALDLRRVGVDVGRIERICVRTYGVAERVAGIRAPQTAFEAKFSIPFCVATAFCHGAVRFAAFEESRRGERALWDLIERTELRVGPEFEEAFPRQRGASVTVTLADGGSHTATRWTRRGDADDPLTDADLREKFGELVGAVLGQTCAAALADALWALPTRATVRSLPYVAAE
jgi:2-methylcitrate dehydratase PrpD